MQNANKQFAAVTLRPAKALPLLLAAEETAYKHWLKPVRAVIQHCAASGIRHHRQRRTQQDQQFAKTRIASAVIFISRTSIFSQIPGVRPITHRSPAINHPPAGQTATCRTGLEPTPPKTITSPLASANIGTIPPGAVNESHGIYRPAGRRGRDDGKQAVTSTPKACFLPSMLTLPSAPAPTDDFPELPPTSLPRYADHKMNDIVYSARVLDAAIARRRQKAVLPEIKNIAATFAPD